MHSLDNVSNSAVIQTNNLVRRSVKNNRMKLIFFTKCCSKFSQCYDKY